MATSPRRSRAAAPPDPALETAVKKDKTPAPEDGVVQSGSAAPLTHCSHVARRSFTLHGQRYSPGDHVPDAVVDALPRPEALVRAGLLDRK